MNTQRLLFATHTYGRRIPLFWTCKRHIGSPSSPLSSQTSNAETLAQQQQQREMLQLVRSIAERREREDGGQQARGGTRREAPWWIKWLLQSSTLSVLLVYIAYQQSLKPFYDMKKTFNGIPIPSTREKEYFLHDEDANVAQLRCEIRRATDQQKIFIFAGPKNNGKGTLLERALLAEQREHGAEICHLKLQGSTLQSLSQHMRENCGLEESLMESIMRKLLNVAVAGATQNTDQAKKEEEISTEVDRRIKRYNQQRQNFFLYKRYSSQKRIIYVDNLAQLLNLFESINDPTNRRNNTRELTFVRDLFAWLSQIENCRVVISASDGFVDDLIRRVGSANQVCFYRSTDLNEQQAKNFLSQAFKKQLNTTPSDDCNREKLFKDAENTWIHDKSNFSRLFNFIGGRVNDLLTFSNNPTEQQLERMKIESKLLVDDATKGLLCATPQACFDSRAVGAVLTALINEEEENQGKGGVIQDKELRHFVQMRTIGSGNGISSCGEGIPIETFLNLEKGEGEKVTLRDLQLMSKYDLISYDPVSKRVSFASRKMRNQLQNYVREHHKLTGKVAPRESVVTVAVK